MLMNMMRRPIGVKLLTMVLVSTLVALALSLAGVAVLRGEPASAG